MKTHCDGEARKVHHEHTGLRFGDPSFRESYAYKLSAGVDSATGKLDLLLDAAGKSAMSFICPSDLITFDSMLEDDVSQNLSRQGRPSPQRFFKIHYVMKQMNLETLVHTYKTMGRKVFSC